MHFSIFEPLRQISKMHVVFVNAKRLCKFGRSISQLWGSIKDKENDNDKKGMSLVECLLFYHA